MAARIRIRVAYAGLAAALLWACAPPAPRPAAQRVPAVVPAPAGTRYDIDPARSSLTVYVYRDGPLARLGHNHVVTLAGLSGSVHLGADPSAVSAVISAPVADFVVDDPVQRSRAGGEFEAQVAAADVAATRANMLGERGLAAALYPRITLAVSAARGGPVQFVLDADCVVRGVRSVQHMPVAVTRAAGHLEARGTATLSQRALGLTPLSLLLGALSVRDAIVVHYELLAREAVDGRAP